MAADIYDKKYNVTKCNQTFEHKKITSNLDKLRALKKSDFKKELGFFIISIIIEI